MAQLRCQLNLWLKGCNKANHPSILASILPEARDTIRAPASNYLPSLSIRALWRVLTAGGITGRWPSISRKTSLKSSDYFLIISSRFCRATPYSLQPATHLNLFSTSPNQEICVIAAALLQGGCRIGHKEHN